MEKFLTVILFLSFAAIYGQNNNTIHQYGTFYCYNEVDTLALFPGGEDELFAFFENRLHPTHLMTGDTDNNIFRVILVLHLSELGFLDSSRFEFNTNVYLEKQIEYALREMPPWIPARKNGVTVSSSIYIPMLIINEGGFFRVAADPHGFQVTENKGFSLLNAALFLSTIAFFVLLWGK